MSDDSSSEERGVPATVIRAGMLREGDPDLEPSLVPNCIDQMFHHWIDPVLRKRNSRREDVTQALVVLAPGEPIEVRLNDEVDFLVSAGEPTRLVDPSTAFVGQITGMWPDAVDPDAPWVGYTTSQSGRVVSMDFRPNRQRVVALLDGAREFLASARDNLASSRLRPAVGDLFSAAELAVLTLIALKAADVAKDHDKRRKWLNGQAQLSDVPTSFASAFAVLVREKNAARYGDRLLKVDIEAAHELLPEIVGLVNLAAERRGT